MEQWSLKITVLHEGLCLFIKDFQFKLIIVLLEILVASFHTISLSILNNFPIIKII